MLKITLQPPSHHTGKLKTGLSCHHSFNNDKRCYVTSSIEKDVDRLIEDLDKAFAKYRGTYHIGSKSKTSEARKRKEQRKNQRTGDWTLQITDEKEKKEIALYLDPWEQLFVLIFVTVYHDACIENLLLRLILFTFRIKLKAPPPSNEWFYFEPPLSWQQFYVMPPPLVFQPPSW